MSARETRKTRRRAGWLVAAALLLGGVAWLTTSDDTVPARAPRAKVAFPRHFREGEHERMTQRRTLPVVATPELPEDAPEDAPPPPRRPRDPVLAALADPEKGAAMVGEVSALRNAPVGEMILSCLTGEQWEDLDRLEKDYGLDVIDGLDRVAFSEGSLVVSGQFADVKWEELLKSQSPETYGEEGFIYEDPNNPRENLGVWGDGLVVLGDRESVERAIDRLEGRADAGAAPIAEGETYGDLYGTIDSETMLRMMGEGDPDLAALIESAVSKVRFHADASSDVAMVFDLEGVDPTKTEELSRTLGGLLVAARMKAQQNGQKALADLLDFARIRPGDESGFSLDLALPEDFLLEHLASCKWRPDNRE